MNGSSEITAEMIMQKDDDDNDNDEQRKIE